MRSTSETTDAGSAMPVPDAPGLHLDPEIARRDRDRRLRRANVVEIPVLRFLGAGAGILLAVVGKLFMPRQVSWEAVLVFSAVVLAYGGLSWLVLWRFYRPGRAVDLGWVFVGLDVLFMLYGIYVTGGDRSWLILLLIVFVASHAHTEFRRVLWVSHLVVAGYAALVLFLVWGEGRAVSWPQELTKLGILYISGLFISLPSRAAEKMRRQRASAIRIARQLIGRLRCQSEIETMITGLSGRFINLAPEGVDRELNEALRAVGELAEADRSYIFLFSDDGERLSNTHEWCAPGVESQIAHLQEIPADAIPWWMAQIAHGGPIRISSVADLPPEAAAEKEIFERESIRALVCVPMLYAGRVRGFLGLDAVRETRVWDREVVGLLKIVGEFMIGTLERRCSERQIRLQAAALESAANAIVITAADGKVRWVNPAFTRLTGYAPDEVLGQNPRVLKSGEHDDAFYRDLWTTIASGRVWHGDIVNRRRDGSLYNEEMTITPVRDAAGVVTDFVAIKQEITERKRAEAQIVEAREAALEASRLKSEFLANMSHEIRTPMNGVVGMIDLALDTGLTEEQRDFLETARSSADALLTIINDILDFSKIEARKLDLESIPFALHDAVEQTLKPLRVLAEGKGITLGCEIAADVPEHVIGDPGRLRQVLANLVGNAVKFTTEGRIDVRVRPLERTPAGLSVEFEVRDTGIGIPAEQQQRMFDAFAQADGSMTRRYGGTGLGLAISRQLVEMMAGTISVRSEPRVGSTFTFSVSVVPTAVADPDPVGGTADRLGGKRVLAADGTAAGGRLMAELLGGWSARSTVVQDAASALEALRDAHRRGEPFDAAILDADLPGGKGFALAERIRHDRRVAAIPLVLLVAGGQRGDAARCRELGIDVYLDKPPTPGDLREALAAVVDRDRRNDATLVTRHWLRENRARLRVLLAEDNRVNRAVATKILEKHGHTVIGVENGREAIEHLEHELFDLVLMDIQMPVMDGFEATRAIRSREDGSPGRLPIIALTAHAMKGDRERCLQAGMDAYVSKPIRSEELFATIEDLLRR